MALINASSVWNSIAHIKIADIVNFLNFETGSIGEVKLSGPLYSDNNDAFGVGSTYLSFLMGSGNRNGALFAIGRFLGSKIPFVGMSGYELAGSRILYYGGGGWGSVIDANEHRFYTETIVGNDAAGGRGTLKLAIDSDGSARPGADNAYSLGTAAMRWSQVYSANAAINTSDKRLKIETDDYLGLDFILSLKPVAYMWKSGSKKLVKVVPGKEPGGNEEIFEEHPGKRVHYGFYAQDVHQAFVNEGVNDFAGWTLDDVKDTNSRQGLRYSEFIAPIVAGMKELNDKIEFLEKRLEKYENE